MRDVFNFAAGPSMLPEEVLLSVQKDLLNFLKGYQWLLTMQNLILAF